MSENNAKKKRRGDRRDATLVRGLDPMHLFMPYLLPNRADNEAVLDETIDMTEVVKYVERRNASNPDFKYTFFHVICAALAKTLVLRPKMNYFISGRRYYERDVISLAFVVKRQFTDSSDEALATVIVDKDSDASPVDQVHDKTRDFVLSVREHNATDASTDTMAILTKLPRFLINFVVKILNFLEYHGILPGFLADDDPYHSSVFISNLGSIKMSADYHHLANWGTNSVFVIVGEKHKAPFYSDDGAVSMRDVLSLGFTIDERIADGIYFAKSIKIMRYLLANPELLDRPINEPVDYKD